MRRKSFNLITYLLIGINLWYGLYLMNHNWDNQLIYTMGAMTGNMPHVQLLTDLLPNTGTIHTLSSPKLSGDILNVARALSASFIHFSSTHLISNMLVLYIIGRQFEAVNYFGLLLPVYGITGIISMLSAYYLQPNALTAGASGAIFGIMGAMITLSFRAKYKQSRAQMEERDAWPYIQTGKYVYPLFIANLIMTYIVPGVSIIGHMGGGISGILIGCVLPMRRSNY